MTSSTIIPRLRHCCVCLLARSHGDPPTIVQGDETQQAEQHVMLAETFHHVSIQSDLIKGHAAFTRTQFRQTLGANNIQIFQNIL